MRISNKFTLSVAAMFVAAGTLTASAQQIWTGPGNVWEDGGATNWDAGSAWTNGNSADFTGSVPLAITLVGTVEAADLSFNGNNYSFSGTDLVLNVAGISDFTVTTGFTATFDNDIDGTAGGVTFRQLDSGTLIFNGNNDFGANGSTLSNGTLQIADAAAFGGTGGITITDGTLSVQGDDTITRQITFTSTATGGIHSDSADVIINGGGNINITDGAAASINFSASTGNKLTIADNLRTPTETDDTINIGGAGTVLLSGANNDFLGTYAVGSGSTLEIEDNDSLGVNAQGVTFNSGTLLSTADIDVSLPLSITSGQSATVISQDLGETLTLSGAINGDGTTSLNVNNNVGAGTVALTNDNSGTFSGAINLHGGTLALGVTGAAGDASGTNVINVLGSTISYADGVNNAVPIVLAADVDLEVGAGDTATQSGVISGAGFGITKIDDGTLILDGANTYTGDTIIDGGTLQLGAAGSLNAATDVDLNNAGSVFDINGVDQTIASLNTELDTTVQLGSATLTIDDTVPAGSSIAGVITDGGALGQFQINSGTVVLESSERIEGTTGVVLNNGGANPSILDLNGNTESVEFLDSELGTEIDLANGGTAQSFIINRTDPGTFNSLLGATVTDDNLGGTFEIENGTVIQLGANLIGDTLNTVDVLLSDDGDPTFVSIWNLNNFDETIAALNMETNSQLINLNSTLTINDRDGSPVDSLINGQIFGSGTFAVEDGEVILGTAGVALDRLQDTIGVDLDNDGPLDTILNLNGNNETIAWLNTEAGTEVQLDNDGLLAATLTINDTLGTGSVLAGEITDNFQGGTLQVIDGTVTQIASDIISGTVDIDLDDTDGETRYNLDGTNVETIKALNMETNTVFDIDEGTLTILDTDSLPLPALDSIISGEIITTDGTGTLVIAEGLLQTTADERIGDNLAVDVENGGTFDINDNIETVESLQSEFGAVVDLGNGTLIIDDQVGTGSLLNGQLVDDAGGFLQIANGTTTLGPSAQVDPTIDLSLTDGALNNSVFDLNDNDVTFADVDSDPNSTIDLGSAVMTITHTSTGQTSFITGAIDGTGQVVFNGFDANSVLWYNNGNKTYSGGTTLNNGIFRPTFQFGGGAGSGDITVTGTTGNTIDYATDGMDLNNNIVLNEDVNLLVDAGDEASQDGVISGSGDVNKTGDGELNLTNTNTYTGATNILAGILTANTTGGDAFQNTPVININGGDLGLSDSGFDLDNNVEVLQNGSILWDEAWSLNAVTDIDLNNNELTFDEVLGAGDPVATINGNIISTGGGGSVVIDDDSFVTYNAVNSYTGGTTLNPNAYLTVNEEDGLDGTGDVSLGNGSTVELNPDFGFYDNNVDVASGFATLKVDGDNTSMDGSFTSDNGEVLARTADSNFDDLFIGGNSAGFSGEFQNDTGRTIIDNTAGLETFGDGVTALVDNNDYFQVQNGSQIDADVDNSDEFDLFGVMNGDLDNADDLAFAETEIFSTGVLTGNVTNQTNGLLDLNTGGQIVGDVTNNAADGFFGFSEGFILNGTVDGNVINNGDARGAGTVTGTLSNNGFLSPGNSIDTLTVGNLNLNNGSTTKFEFDPDIVPNPGTSHDLITVNGDAFVDDGTINGTEILLEDENFGFVPDKFAIDVIRAETPIATNGGPVDPNTGALTNLDVEFENDNMNVMLDGAFARIDPNDDTMFQVVINRNNYEDLSFLKTTNQERVAQGLDNLADSNPNGLLPGTEFYEFLSGLDFLASNDQDGFLEALYQLSPERYDIINRTHLNVTQRATDALTEYQFTRRSGLPQPTMAQGEGQGMMFASTGTDPYMMNLAFDEQERERMSREGNIAGTTFSVWAQGFYIYEDSDSNGVDELTGYTANTGGGQVGVDMWAMDNLLVGLAFTFTGTHADYAGAGGNADIYSYRIGPYVSWEVMERWWIDFSATYAFSTIDSNRDINALSQVASADYNGHDVSVYIGTEYDVLPETEWYVAPLVGLNYVWFHQEGFTETGAGPANLTVDAQDTHSLNIRAGGRVAWIGELTPEIRLIPELLVAYRGELLRDTNSDITAAFGNGAGSFDMPRGSTAYDAVEVGAGVNMLIGNNWSVFVRYNGVFGFGDGNTQTHLGSAGVGFSF